MAELLQLPPQFRVVVDFAVEDQDGVAIVAGMGWSPCSRSMILRRTAPERHVGRFPDALLVGAAVNQRSRNLPDPVRIRAFLRCVNPAIPHTNQ